MDAHTLFAPFYYPANLISDRSGRSGGETNGMVVRWPRSGDVLIGNF